MSWDTDHSSSKEENPDYEIYIFIISQRKRVVGTDYMRLTEDFLMITHNICFLWEIRKKKYQASKSWLDKWNFDHLLVHGQVITFDNATTLYKMHLIFSEY